MENERILWVHEIYPRALDGNETILRLSVSKIGSRREGWIAIEGERVLAFTITNQQQVNQIIHALNLMASDLA